MNSNLKDANYSKETKVLKFSVKLFVSLSHELFAYNILLQYNQIRNRKLENCYFVFVRSIDFRCLMKKGIDPSVSN